MTFDDYLNLDVLILDHANKHGLTDAQIDYAWRHAVDLRISKLDNGEILIKAIGYDTGARAIELSGLLKSAGYVCIFHANTPPTHRCLQEFGLFNKRRGTHGENKTRDRRRSD